MGLMRGLIDPSHLTAADINQLIAGSLRLQQSPVDETARIGTESNAPLPLLQITIRPAMSVTGMSGGATRRQGNIWEIWGAGLRQFLADAYDIPSLRIILPESYESATYDVSIALPDDSEENRKTILRQLITSTFAVQANREMRDMDVYVLRPLSGSRKQLKILDDGNPLASVVRYAEAFLQRPVVDETGMKEKYDFVLAPKNETELQGAVNDLGLNLLPARRKIDVLVIKPIESH